MSFFKKIERIGKDKERYIANIKIVYCELNVTQESLVTVVYKRGPQTDETSRKRITVSMNGVPTKVFYNESFSRTTNIYKKLKNH